MSYVNRNWFYFKLCLFICKEDRTENCGLRGELRTRSQPRGVILSESNLIMWQESYSVRYRKKHAPRMV
jgi:hypothetical protein